MPLVGILMTQSTTTYGLTSRGVPMFLFKPMDPTLIPRKVAWKDADRNQNHWVLIHPVPEVNRLPRGELLKVLGPCGTWSVERSALMHAIQPGTWPKILPPLIAPKERRLLDMPTVHIDPPRCRDIDDAISILGDHYAITIADVAAWVKLNPWLAEGAAAQGQTIYSTDGVVLRPMLPDALSEDLISLHYGVRRAGIALEFDWTPEEGFRNVDLGRVDVIVTGSYTYESAHKITEFPVQKLKALVEYIQGDPCDDPHVWVETLMLFYGRTAGMALQEMGKGILRCQTPPDREKLARYESVCPAAALLCQSAATYMAAPEATPHYGLESYYCHVTSPIRRWVDIVNQSALMDEEIAYDLEQINLRDKQLKKYRRDLFFLDQLEYPVQPIAAKVVDLRESKTKLWVPSWKRVISVDRTDLALGEDVKLRYHLDMNRPTWKRRMVVQVGE